MMTESPDIETSSEEYALRFSGEVGEYFLELQSKITLELLQSHPRASILDVGGGHAQLAVPLFRKGFKVSVTGSHPKCRERLDHLLKPDEDIPFYTCDLLDLPFEDRSFDIVLAFRLLPHMEQWQKLIGEMCRVAKQAVIIDYPDIRSANILYKIMFNAKKAFEVNTRPFSLFDRKMVANEFSRHNFGKPVFKAEFFFPMVIHRMLKSARFSQVSEEIFKNLGMTSLLGSPIILKASRLGKN